MRPDETNLASIGERFPWLSFVVAAAFFLLFAIILFIVYVPERPGPVDQARIEERLTILKDLKAKDQKALTTYSWVESSPGTVRIPIDRAMDLVVREYTNTKPAPAILSAPLAK